MKEGGYPSIGPGGMTKYEALSAPAKVFLAKPEHDCLAVIHHQTGARRMYASVQTGSRAGAAEPGEANP